MFGSQRLIEDVLLSMSSMDYFTTTRRVIISNQDVSVVPSQTELFYIGSVFDQVTYFPSLLITNMGL